MDTMPPFFQADGGKAVHHGFLHLQCPYLGRSIGFPGGPGGRVILGVVPGT